jgi:hypothetical protein
MQACLQSDEYGLGSMRQIPRMSAAAKQRSESGVAKIIDWESFDFKPFLALGIRRDG